MATEEVGRKRPVPLHKEKHPDLDVDGCFGCKAASISFGGVETLRQQRELGTTSSEMLRDWQKGWKEDGIDVKKAGSTSPTSGPLM